MARVNNTLKSAQAFLVEVTPEVLSSLSGVLAPWGPGVLGSWGPGSWNPREPRHDNIVIANYKSRITNDNDESADHLALSCFAKSSVMELCFNSMTQL